MDFDKAGNEAFEKPHIILVNDKPKYKVRRRKVINDATPNSSHTSHMRNVKINQMQKRKRDFMMRINYSNFLTILVMPVIGVGYLMNYSPTILPENRLTFWFSIIYFNITILSFTCGYHKFFTHNAFTTNFKVIRYMFAIFGSSVGLGSIKWWASLHRAHHQYTDDTEKDPYLIKRGFYFAHFGWLMKKPKLASFYEQLIEQAFPAHIDISNEINDFKDLEYDEVDIKRQDYRHTINQMVVDQHKKYFIYFILTTIIIPIIITTYYCHDSLTNAIIYPGILRMFLCQQCLLLTESVCHFGEIQVSFPTQPFNDENSSVNCNNPILSLLTYGQAKQNFHHEFPHDYRNDCSIFSFDPTKWVLFIMSKLYLIDDLSVTPTDLITQLKIQQQQKVLNRFKTKLNWGTPISKLPLITPIEFKRLISTAAHKDRIYIVIQDIIHDVTPFMDQHPGGLPLLKASHGKDATKAFFGGVYGHLTAAQNLLATMRIGYLDLGDDEAVWTKIVDEEGEVDNGDSSHRDGHHQTAEAA